MIVFHRTNTTNNSIEMEKCLDRIEALLEICEINCGAIYNAQNRMLSLNTDMVRNSSHFLILFRTKTNRRTTKSLRYFWTYLTPLAFRVEQHCTLKTTFLRQMIICECIYRLLWTAQTWIWNSSFSTLFSGRISGFRFSRMMEFRNNV